MRDWLLRVGEVLLLIGVVMAAVPSLTGAVLYAQEDAPPRPDPGSGSPSEVITSLYSAFDVPNPDSMFAALSDQQIHQDFARFEDERWVFPVRFGSQSESATACRAAGLTHTVRVMWGLNEMGREGDFVVNMECHRHRVRIEVDWAERTTVTEVLRSSGEVVYQRSRP